MVVVDMHVNHLPGMALHIVLCRVDRRDRLVVDGCNAITNGNAGCGSRAIPLDTRDNNAIIGAGIFDGKSR